MLRRRTLLLGSSAAVVAAGAVGAAGVATRVLPGRSWVDRTLGLTGADGQIPDVAPGPVLQGSFTSQRRGGIETGWTLLLPPGAEPARALPLVLALPGRGGTHTSVLDLGVDRFLAQAVDDGAPPFAIACADVGESYYHPHDGEDVGAMLLDELAPRMRPHGVDTRRIGFYGWSMGGYGSLRLAAILGRDRVFGLAVASPALWVSPGDASPAGFDDAEEYEQYSVMGHQGDLAGIPVRIDIGRDDPFYEATREYVAGFPAAAGVVSTFGPGAHDDGFWRRVLPAELGFLGKALAGTE